MDSVPPPRQQSPRADERQREQRQPNPDVRQRFVKVNESARAVTHGNRPAEPEQNGGRNQNTASRGERGGGKPGAYRRRSQKDGGERRFLSHPRKLPASGLPRGKIVTDRAGERVGRDHDAQPKELLLQEACPRYPFVSQSRTPQKRAEYGRFR